jgi:FixJ family two-component response regulator
MHLQYSQDTEDAVRSRLSLLSERERQLVKYLALGYSNVEVSFVVGIASATVKIHRARIYKKLGVSTLKDLMHALEVKPCYSLG